MSEDIESAILASKEKKYSEFEDAIKNELKTKLAKHPTIKKYSDGIDQMNALKAAYSEINKRFEEPEVDKEVKEEPEGNEGDEGNEPKEN